MQAWLGSVKKNPQEFLLGMCVLMIAASGGAVKNVASTAVGIMFITSLFYWKSWKHTWQDLDKAEKLILIGFVLYTLTALLSWVNAENSVEFVKQGGRYIRFALVIPVYLMIRAKQLSLAKYLLVGVVLSGFVYLSMALHSIAIHPALPAAGGYHHITFGDAAMLNVAIMGVMILMLNYKLQYRLLISVSLICAMYAVLLSQARGAWIAMPLYLLMAFIYLISVRKSDAIKMVIICAIAAIVIMLSPAGNVIKTRYSEAVTDVTEFAHGVKSDTSVGSRFAMWEIAYDVWKEHPIIGTGLGDFGDDMIRYQAMGDFRHVQIMDSTHNIFVQALAGTGIIGFFALCYALVVAPLMMFGKKSMKEHPWGVMGMILVVSYAVFGLSESWILRAPAVSIYIAYMITLMSSHKNGSGSIKSHADMLNG